tara:strand:+ start:97 stop:567 length:471 start_codon:yes stop_codon:yes gene_type:complete
MKKLHYFGIKCQQLAEEFFVSIIGCLFLLIIGIFALWPGIGFIVGLVTGHAPGIGGWIVGIGMLLLGLYYIKMSWTIFYHAILSKEKINNAAQKKQFLKLKYRAIYKDKLIVVQAPISKNGDWEIKEALPIWGVGYYKYILVESVKNTVLESELKK